MNVDQTQNAERQATQRAADRSPAQHRGLTEVVRRNLPRPESWLLVVALAATVGTKLVVVRRHQPESLFIAWADTAFPDLLFFAAVALVFRLVYLLRPHSLAARFTMLAAAAVLAWSFLNLAWLISTGVQLQPGILRVISYAPGEFLPAVEGYVRRHTAGALTAGALVSVAGCWFVLRLVRPAPVVRLRRHHIRLAIMTVIVIAACVGARFCSHSRTSLHFSGEVLGFSSHWHALTRLWSGPSEDMPEQARELPRVGDRDIGLPGASREPLPNIVILLLESIPHSISSLGDPQRDRTPNLARIAEEGVELVSTHVPVSQTGKAYWSTLIGTTPEIYHDYSEAILVDKPYESLPSILARRGYTSAFFEMSKGSFECAPAFFANTAFDWGWWLENLEDPSAKLGYLAGDDFRMIEPAFSWVDQRSGPFLLMMITSVAHEPYAVPDWYGPEKPTRYENYLQAVKYTDDFVGEICEQLRIRGLEDNTVLCVLGDHGESFRPEADRGRWVPYEEVIRVPWVVRWPGHIEAGRKVDWPCSQLDVTPTLLTLLGFDISRAGFDGRDALTPGDPDRCLYFSSWFENSPMGFLKGTQKWIYWPYQNKVFEYDLEKDPGERRPLTITGDAKERMKVDVLKWRRDSRIHFDAKRFRERMLFDHWRVFASGRDAWAYYVP